MCVPAKAAKPSAGCVRRTASTFRQASARRERIASPCCADVEACVADALKPARQFRVHRQRSVRGNGLPGARASFSSSGPLGGLVAERPAHRLQDLLQPDLQARGAQGAVELIQTYSKIATV